ncbi:MAG: SRPBCC domain-containing protein [Myxococcota bacterium]
MSSSKRTVLTSIAIDAPPAEVWDTLGDSSSWDRWNPMFGGFSGPFRAGASLDFQVALGIGKVPLAVTVVRADGEELRWEGPRAALQRPFAGANHYFRLEPLDGGARTRLVHGESFSGALLALIWPHVRKMLPAAYDQVNAALKREVEGR